MKKAGGIIAVIGGILGIAAAFFIWGFIDMSPELSEAPTQPLLKLVLPGMIFSIIAVIFGVIAVTTNNDNFGMFLIISAVIGVFLSPNAVAICLGITLIGGAMIMFGKPVEQVSTN